MRGLLCFGLMFFLSIGAHAAQLLKVEVDRAKIFEGPSRSAGVVSELPLDMPLAASNLSIQGFYKIRTEDGRLGFIEVSNVGPLSQSEALSELYLPPDRAQVEEILKLAPEAPADQKKIQLFFLGGYGIFNSPELSDATGLTGVRGGAHFGAELDARMSKGVSLGVRFEFIRSSASVLDLSGSNEYLWDFSSFPVQVGLALNFWLSQAVVFRADAFGGLGFTTQLTSSPGDSSTATNQTVFSSMAPTFSTQLALQYWIQPGFALFVSGGYRYLRSSEIQEPIIEGASGTEIFKVNGSYVPFPINLSGVSVQAGLGIAL
jgi:hypothetical protein